jgi:hypothetical protein
MPHFDWVGAGVACLIGIGGLLVTAVGAIFGAKEKDKWTFEAGPLALAVVGLVIGVGAALNQYGAAKESDRKSAEAQKKAEAAYKELDQTKKAVDGASINIQDLAALNALSPTARYRIRLSSDPTAQKACATAEKINRTFPGAIDTGGIRVIKVGSGPEPYYLVFGHDLTLASAEIYQRLAVAHSLSNGLAPIEHETGSKDAVACSSVH